jgi:hypothetical protein
MHWTIPLVWSSCLRRKPWNPSGSWTGKGSSIPCGPSRRRSSAAYATATRTAWHTASPTPAGITRSCSAPNGLRKSLQISATAAGYACVNASMARSGIPRTTGRCSSMRQPVTAAACAGLCARRMRSRCRRGRVCQRRPACGESGALCDLVAHFLFGTAGRFTSANGVGEIEQ